MFRRIAQKFFKLVAATVVAAVSIPVIFRFFGNLSFYVLFLGTVTYFYICYNIIFTSKYSPKIENDNSNRRINNKLSTIDIKKKPNKIFLYDSTLSRTLPEYLLLFKKYISNNGLTFRDRLLTIVSYCEKFINKRKLINNTLLNHLSKTELTYIKFSGIISSIEDSVNKILNDILSHLHSFDESEYEQILSNPHHDADKFRQRQHIYNEYSDYIDHSINYIDEIIIKIDQLQLEINKMKALDFKSIDYLDSVKNITDLINTIKYYKT
jgi:hypothetical protein